MNTALGVEAIFWDNDGVLVDTERLYYRASRDVLGEAGIELDWDAFTDISLRRGQSVFELARDSGCSKERLAQMRLRRNQLYAELLNTEASIMDGAEETLSFLHGKVPMAIVTSSLKEHFDIIHKQTRLLRYFDFILTREDYRHSKPHPEPYLTALSRAQSTPQRSLVIEDSERGLRAAIQAQVPCVILAPHASPGAFPNASAVISSLRELPSLLE